MDIQKIKELALANGFSLKEQASGNMDLHSYVYEFANALLKEAIPEGSVLVANNSKTVVSIEKMVEQQVEASGITQDIFRLDGGRILEAIIEAQEQSHE